MIAMLVVFYFVAGAVALALSCAGPGRCWIWLRSAPSWWAAAMVVLLWPVVVLLFAEQE